MSGNQPQQGAGGANNNRPGFFSVIQGNAIDYESEEYEIPDGFPGEMRNGVVHLEGNQVAMADAIITHLEYVASTYGGSMNLKFEATDRSIVIGNVVALVEQFARGTELGSKVKVDGVEHHHRRISFICPVSETSVMVANLFANQIERALGGTGDRILMNPNINGYRGVNGYY